MEIIIKSSYGMIKHNETDEDLAVILSLFLAENSTLLFSFYERNMPLCDADVQKFILDRCRFINSEWVLPWTETIPHWDESPTPPRIIWFSVTEKIDIMQAIKIDNLFRCVVIKQGEEFEQHLNVLFHQEYYSSIDEKEYDYYLGFTNKTDLLSRVLPGIKERYNIDIKIM
ncbi:hypothetical protein MHI24_10885 [Paenibacillus sp. FSL K6-1096]|uniref:hypothetical protein n=1 Tax=Paenibacillus sp. FSL K6-1096 TaxID=2921460 RepID=UPI0030EF851D